MQNTKTNLFAAFAALFMTAILAAPIAVGEGSGAAPIFATSEVTVLA